MSRHIDFYYVLGNLSSAASGNKKFGLFAPVKVSLGDSFYLTAVIARPAEGETIRLELPDGFVFGKNEKAEKEIKQQNVDYTQLSWLVFACKQTDSATLQAILNPGDKREKIKIKVEPVGITRPGGVCP